MTIDLSVNPDFKKLIPPLTTEEYEQLEQNIIEEGVRDRLCTWHGWIIDGHNRYEIATLHGIPFDTVEFDFDSEDEVKDWMIANQLGKRNLTREQKSYLRGKQYTSEKKKVTNETGSNQYSEVELGGNNYHQPKTHERLAEQHKVSPRTIQNDEKYANALDKIAKVAGEEVKNSFLNRDIKATQKDIIEISKKDDDKIMEITSRAVEVKDIKKVSGAHIGNNSGENEWYTPSHIIDLAKEVFGGSIDLDPASSLTANEQVGAEFYFNADDNGLEKDWFGDVWLNPPYAQPLMSQFAEKVVYEKYRLGPNPYTSCIILVNNATETKWFQLLAKESSAICFPQSRIRFWHPDRVSSPLQGQAIIYIGKEGEKFGKVFSSIGFCLYANFSEKSNVGASC